MILRQLSRFYNSTLVKSLENRVIYGSLPTSHQFDFTTCSVLPRSSKRVFI